MKTPSFTAIVLSLLCASLAGPSPVAASDFDDGPADIYNPASPRTWTGFYVGVGVGAVNSVLTQSGEFSYSRTWFGGSGGSWSGASGSWSGEADGQGFLGYVQIGGDYRFGQSRFFAGAFADADWLGVESTEKSSYARHYVGGAPFYEPPLLKCRLYDQWTGGGRIGVLVSADTAAYLLAGYTQADGGAESTRGTTPHEFTADGWTAGGGVETRVANGVFLKAEYRFTELSKELYDVGQANSNSWRHIYTAYVQPEVHAVRVGVAYKFGGGAN